MGLKTTNYEAKKIGETLPEAYAMLDRCLVVKNNAYATFGIYAERDEAKKFNSVETKALAFEWDRKTDIAEQAYNLAKAKGGILEGWEDDIV